MERKVINVGPVWPQTLEKQIKRKMFKKIYQKRARERTPKLCMRGYVCVYVVV